MKNSNNNNNNSKSNFIDVLPDEHYISEDLLQEAQQNREVRSRKNELNKKRKETLGSASLVILPLAIALLLFIGLSVLFFLIKVTPPNEWYWWIIYLLGVFAVMGIGSWLLLHLSISLPSKIKIGDNQPTRFFYLPLLICLVIAELFLIIGCVFKLVPLVALVLDSVAFAVGFVFGTVKHNRKDKTFRSPFSSFAPSCLLGIICALFATDMALCITISSLGILTMFIVMFLGDEIIGERHGFGTTIFLKYYLPSIITAALYVGLTVALAINPFEHDLFIGWWFLYIPVTIGLMVGIKLVLYIASSNFTFIGDQRAVKPMHYYFSVITYLTIVVSFIIVAAVLEVVPLTLTILQIVFLVSETVLWAIFHHFYGSKGKHFNRDSITQFATSPFLTVTSSATISIYLTCFAYTSSLCITLAIMCVMTCFSIDYARMEEYF